MQHQIQNSLMQEISTKSNSQRKALANRSKKTMMQIFAKIKQKNTAASARSNLADKGKINLTVQQPETTIEESGKIEKEQIQTCTNNSSKIHPVQHQKHFTPINVHKFRPERKSIEAKEHPKPYSHFLNQASEIQKKLKLMNFIKNEQKSQDNYQLLTNIPKEEMKTPNQKPLVTQQQFSPSKIRRFLEKQKSQKQIIPSKSQKQLFINKPLDVSPSRVQIPQRTNQKFQSQPKKQIFDNNQAKSTPGKKIQRIKLYKNSFELQRNKILEDISTNTNTTRSQLYNKYQNVNAFSVKNLRNVNVNVTTNEQIKDQSQINISSIDKIQNFSFNNDVKQKQTKEQITLNDKSFQSFITQDNNNQSKASSNAYSFSILKEMKPNLKDLNSEQNSINTLNNSALDVCTNKNASSQFLQNNHQDLTPSALFSKLNAPLTSKLALQVFKQNLTAFEVKEINDYDYIFFLGLEAKKVQSNLMSKLNLDYDDENGDYKVIYKDHIAYRYEILEVLGKGSFGQVIRCFDHKRKEMCAVKMIKNKKRFHHQAAIEVKILSYMKERDYDHDFNVVHLKNYFLFRQHLCIVFELLSINLYEGLSIGLVKRLAIQILQSLKFLHMNKIIHCDLKPENILLKQQNSSQIKIIDFGSSCFEHERMYTYIQSRFYRAPEIILGLSYNMGIDMWSFGCILGELHSGYPLFPGENEIEQILCMQEILGKIDEALVLRSPRKKLFFDSNNQPKIIPNSRGKIRNPGTKTLDHAIKSNDSAFLDFVEKCLVWDPFKRMTPEQALQHPWILEESNKHVQPSQQKNYSLRRRRVPETFQLVNEKY